MMVSILAGAIAIVGSWKAKQKMLDEDDRPLPARPWEPPGPPPKRKLTDAGRMFVVFVITAVAFLATCVLVARFGE